MDESKDTVASPGEMADGISAAEIVSDWNSVPTANQEDYTSGRDGSENYSASKSWPDDSPATGPPVGENNAGGGVKQEANQSFALKHLGEVRNVSRDEMITLAQKGLDYDRQRQKNDELMSKNKALSSETERLRGYSGQRVMTREEAAAKRRDTDIGEFIAEYGGIDPKNIPREVWQDVTGGKPLLAAYQSWELKKLKAESAAKVKAAENREKSAGSRTSAGSERHRDAITADWYS